jgi:hypothetical protein
MMMEITFEEAYQISLKVEENLARKKIQQRRGRI